MRRASRSLMGTIQQQLTVFPGQINQSARLRPGVVLSTLGAIPLDSQLNDLRKTETSPQELKSIWSYLGAFILVVAAFISWMFDVLGKVVIPIVVVLVTWLIKDSVEDALKEREFEVTTAKAMQSSLATLRSKEELTQESADAAALTLATMGTASIMLLIYVHNTTTSTQVATAVAHALPFLGLTQHDDLCKALAFVVSDSSARFVLPTTKLAVIDIGTSNCRDDLPVLRTLLSSLKAGDDKIATHFLERPAHSDIESLRTEVQNAIGKLAPTSDNP